MFSLADAREDISLGWEQQIFSWVIHDQILILKILHSVHPLLICLLVIKLEKISSSHFSLILHIVNHVANMSTILFAHLMQFCLSLFLFSYLACVIDHFSL